MITAKVIKKSREVRGKELTTLELCYPRYIHSEFMTHREFCRNAQSNRAIPVVKVIEDILVNPVEPIFMRNQKGMQADLMLSDQTLEICKDVWSDARDSAIRNAEQLINRGVHKQIANRLLEPFAHIRVIVSSTQWDNFFSLRIAPDAQQEICELAKAMKEAIDSATSDDLGIGDYHLPYISDEELVEYRNGMGILVKASVARCARVSYLNHDNSNPDISNDLILHDKLLKSRHMSPFEHIATPSFGPHANFRGFKSYRRILEESYKTHK